MAFGYGQLSQFLHNPGPVHMAVAERALAYVRGTHDQGLSYCDPGADNRNGLTGWVNNNFAVKLHKCEGALIVANALTKSLPRSAFHQHAPFMHGTRCP